MADSNVGSVLTGFAQSLPGGIQLGQQRLKIAQDQAELEAKIKAQQAAAQQADAEHRLQKFAKSLDFFKEVPKSLKPNIWKTTIAPQANEMFGAGFNPDVYPDEATPLLDDAQTVLQNYQKKKIGFNDTVNMLTQLQGKLTAAGEDKASESVDKMTGNIQAAQDNRVRQQENATREPAGTREIPEFLTRDLLKKNGLTDEQITEGQRTGKIPQRLTRDESALIIQSLKGAKGKFTLHDFHSGNSSSGLSGDSFSQGLGF